ncbi:MAG: methyltransferase domain-containing protein [Flavipsychrobacter sp.]
MATKQTIDFFKQFSGELQGPCLEIGSLVDASYVQYAPKDIHEGNMPKDFIGIDIFEGEGVDYVVNLCDDESIAKLPIQKYKTIHCHYVMEHVTDIFGMAKNIEKLLDKDGVLLFSVPFSWRLHRIPIDMWRFTPQGIDYLFPNIEFIDSKSVQTPRRGNKFSRVEDVTEFDFGSGLNKYPWYISMYVKALRKLGLDNGIFNQRAMLHETNLMMYGIKRDKPTYTYIDPKYI